MVFLPASYNPDDYTMKIKIGPTFEGFDGYNGLAQKKGGALPLSLDGKGKSIYKWIRTGGTPMTWETSLFHRYWDRGLSTEMPHQELMQRGPAGVSRIAPEGNMAANPPVLDV